jgi:hypothetical protein
MLSTHYHAAWWALQLVASEATGTVSDIARSIAIVVASYQFAAGRAALVAWVAWDLVVFDEAAFRARFGSGAALDATSAAY